MRSKCKKSTLLLLAVMLVAGLITVMPLMTSAEGTETTYNNLYASVQGETNAAAAYRAFAAKAEEEGYPVVARLFRATADAEAKHADDEWAILQGMGATERPTAEMPTVGTTAQNLQAAFDGETYEYTVMYPGFLATAQAEGMSAAVTMFRRAMRAEEVHASNFKDVLDNLGNIAYVNTKYATVYRCLICGEVVTARPASCPICYAAGSTFVMYGDEITQYTVTFNSDGGTMVAPQTVNAGACASKPAEPMKDGYTFIGWYENGSDTAYDFETPVMKNLTLTAKWEMQVIIPPIPKVIVNGVEIEIEIKNGVAIVDLTKLTDAMIKQILDGSEIIFDLRDYDKVDIKAPAACFKEYDKTITIKTSGGSGTVKTKTLWNNSGKNRLVSVRNGKVSIDNI